MSFDFELARLIDESVLRTKHLLNTRHMCATREDYRTLSSRVIAEQHILTALLAGDWTPMHSRPTLWT